MGSKFGKSRKKRDNKFKGFDRNYAVMVEVARYLPRFEQLNLQQLDKWWYKTGASRAQVTISLAKMILFAVVPRAQIVALSVAGDRWKLGFEEMQVSPKAWISCHLGRVRLFQVCSPSSYRVLKIYQGSCSISIEREGEMKATQIDGYFFCLANLNEQFVFAIPERGPLRYSLAEDKWEALPDLDCADASACSLANKVYVLGNSGGIINVLHNPGASVSSQEPPHWQVIEVPPEVPQPRTFATFVPLNSAEIAILGGMGVMDRGCGSVISFNVTTCEFKTELDGRSAFVGDQLESVNVCENTIVSRAGTKTKFTYFLYIKGNNCLNHL